MSEKPISPLRQRMLEDMNVRRFTPDTQREYVRAVKRLAAFLNRSPDTATAEELRAFQVHLTETGVRPPTINATVTGLRFFFKVTLDRPETTRHLVFVYEPRKLPRVLSPDEVLRLLEAGPPAPSTRRRSAWLTGWPAGHGGGGPEGQRCRFQTHDAAGRTRQGLQGSLCDALPAAVGAVTRLVAHRASPGVDVPRP
jgi:hypothetical protein